jgi:hypothetical protein
MYRQTAVTLRWLSMRIQRGGEAGIYRLDGNSDIVYKRIIMTHTSSFNIEKRLGLLFQGVIIDGRLYVLSSNG